MLVWCRFVSPYDVDDSAKNVPLRGGHVLKMAWGHTPIEFLRKSGLNRRELSEEPFQNLIARWVKGIIRPFEFEEVYVFYYLRAEREARSEVFPNISDQ